jgi:hypothetical protein
MALHPQLLRLSSLDTSLRRYDNFVSNQQLLNSKGYACFHHLSVCRCWKEPLLYLSNNALS